MCVAGYCCKDFSVYLRMNLPMNLESFKAGTVTFLVSNARNAPNTNNKPETDKNTCLLFTGFTPGTKNMIKDKV